MRLMAAIYPLCTALLMTIGVFASTPAEAGYDRSSHHRAGFHRGYRVGLAVKHAGNRGGYFDFGHRIGFFSEHGIEYSGNDYKSPYGVGYGAGYGYYNERGYRYGSYGYYPGYVRGCGNGCNRYYYY
jgi:hypothetical protein